MDIPQVELGFLPTPLHYLPRLTRALGGPEIWIKRDDQTGLATGGNKTRKLRLLVAEALAQGADTLVTGGAIQSNHARQTAAAAAQFGLECHLILRGEAPTTPNGNLLLDYLLGAHIHWVDSKEAMHATLPTVAEALREVGKQPYVIPYGGSNGLGAAAYALAVAELLRQMPAPDFFDAVVFPSSSGGTQAGLVAGAHIFGLKGEILGISVDEPASHLAERVARLAQDAAAVLDVDMSVDPSQIRVDDTFRGGGYAVVSDLEREAIRTLARLEGILLDPVYTGRAFGGLIRLVRRRRWQAGQRILFWHTGGIPALFAFAQELMSGE
ncbi:MAG: D-cysteine desulfhydrase family protein [Chloroflexi bacterium]|nr:D-cysteine desulfhydrase family protein [Chloroflexota bacterium]